MSIQGKWLFIATVVLTLWGASTATYCQITTNWTGTGGNANFFNPGNWDNGIPLSQDEAVFGSLSPFTVSMNSNAFIGTFTHPIGTMTLTGGNGLTVNSSPGLTSFLAVVNPGTHFTSLASLSVGEGGLGSLVLLGGGSAFVNNNASIGSEAGFEGRLTVNGLNSNFTSQELRVGDSGEGILLIQNQGIVTNNRSRIGLSSNSIGEATVTGAGSLWQNVNFIAVGVSGTGTVNIANGGRVSAIENAFVGVGVDGTGTVNVDGLGTELSTSGFLNVGYDGQGALNVINSGGVVAETLRIGESTTATGTVDVQSGGVIDATTIIVGQEGNGSVVVSDGGILNCDVALISEFEDGVGDVQIVGDSSRWNIGDFMVVADNRATGTLNIENGAKVEVGVNGFIGDFSGFQPNTTGTVNVSGADSELSVEDFLMVGNNGLGTLQVTDDALVNAETIRVGRRPGSMGMTIIETGGFVLCENLEVGREGTGDLSIVNGGILSCNTASIGQFATAIGSVEVLGNGSSLNCVDLEIGDQGIGRLFIRDGAVANVMGTTFIAPGAGLFLSSSVNGFAGELNSNGPVEVHGGIFVSDDANIHGDVSLVNDGELTVDFDSVANLTGDFSGNGFRVSVLAGGTVNFFGEFDGDLIFQGPGTAAFHDRVVLDSGPSFLSVLGNVELIATSTLEIEIGGTLPGVDHDQMAVSGDLLLFSGGLSVSTLNGFQPIPGQEFVIVNVNGARLGEFAGIAQGDVVASLGNNVDLIMDYAGGNGDDIALVAIAAGVLLGDINLDGIVNLLDVGPFIDLIADGQFQTEADVNEDGVVNLLDAGPFIALLNGG